MKKLITLSLVLISFKQYALTPEEIIQKADNIRNPRESFYMQVEVKDSDGEISLFDVFTHGKDKTLIKTLAPRHSLGRNLLMLEENMWLYIPNLGRAIRVSLSQKLTGQAANGDISRMRWSGDYNVTPEKDSKKEVVLFLTSKRKGLTYDKIRVYIEKPNHRPLKAHYLAFSGKLLKEAHFKDYKMIADEIRPTTITITDANKNDKKSIITILKMEKRNLLESMFNKMHLK